MAREVPAVALWLPRSVGERGTARPEVTGSWLAALCCLRRPVGTVADDIAPAHIRVLTDVAQVRDAADTWTDLTSQSCSVTSSAWILAWLEAYGDRYHPTVVTAVTTRTTEAVFPLVRSRRHPWWLEAMGERELFEPTDGIATTRAAIAPVVAELARRRIPLRFRRLPTDSPLLQHLHDAFGRKAIILALPSGGTPTITLDQAWHEPESRFSSRRQQDFRAARRRAHELGAVEFAVVQPTAVTAPSLFDEFVALEDSGWKGREGTALACQPEMRKFYRRYCELASREGTLRLGVLRIGGQIAAMQIAAEYDRGFYLLKIAFDEQFARCSPGTLLMLHTTKWAADRGNRSYEFLGAEEPWTAVWTTDLRPCVQVHVYPISPWSIAAAGETIVRAARRAARAEGRARLRRGLIDHVLPGRLRK